MKDDDSMILESDPKGMLWLGILIGLFLPLGVLLIMNILSGGTLLGYDPIANIANFFAFISEFLNPTIGIFYLPLIYSFAGLLIGLVSVKWWKALLASGIVVSILIGLYISIGLFVVGFPAILVQFASILFAFLILILWIIVPSIVGAVIIASVLEKKTCYSSDLS